MQVCIHYAKPSSGQLEGEVYGLDVAVNNFLSAWFRYGKTEKFMCRPVDIESFDHFEKLAAAEGVEQNRCIGLDPRTPQSNLNHITCLFRPDPLISGPMWQRGLIKDRAFAICGLVHTMSGERIVRAVEELCLSPAEAGDALICPSPAIRDAVQNLWGIYGDYLNHHFGSSYRCPLDTPVIPLGIDSGKFIEATSGTKRRDQRVALNIADDEIVLLFWGRLSFATKAHPLPLFVAAEKAAATTRKRLRIVMYGYFKPREMEEYFKKLADDTLSKVRIDFVLNGDPRFPHGFWAGADIFVSLADNIQESFGLTPLEAMASGLPVIASDWDGYRGGVRQGQEGFLIATTTPPQEAGQAIAEYYFNQQNYGVALVAAAQSTAIDIGQCTEAIRRLADDDDLRKNMGEKGRLRVAQNYDWRIIIKAYEELWQNLAEKRFSSERKSPVPNGWQAAHPAFPNPYAMFSSFPTTHLKPEDFIEIKKSRLEIEALLANEMNFFVPDLLMPKDLLLNLIDIFRTSNPNRIEEMLRSFPKQEQGRVWRCLGWMLKLGIAELKKP